MYLALQLSLLLLLGLAYLRRVARLRAERREPSLARQLCFAAGLILAVSTTLGPMDSLASELVFGHMIQHLLLTDEAALLLAIGLTGPVLAPIIGRPALRWVRNLTHPVVALLLWIAAIYAWHVPALYEAAERHLGLHVLEHSCFLGAGLFMWMAVVGPFPKPRWFGSGAKVLYVVAVHLSMMALANFFMWSGSVLYPIYAQSEAARHISPLTDQGLAGVVAMIQSALVMFTVFFWALIQWAKQDTARQELLDFAYLHGIELSEERASRAAAAGRAGELRSRLERELDASGAGHREPS